MATGSASNIKTNGPIKEPNINNPPLSPHAIAEAALEAALVEQKKSISDSTCRSVTMAGGGGNSGGSAMFDRKAYGNFMEEKKDEFIEEKRDDEKCDEGHHPCQLIEGNQTFPDAFTLGDNQGTEEKLRNLWEEFDSHFRGEILLKEGKHDVLIDAAVESTEQVLHSAFDSFIRKGMDAFNKLESVSRELAKMEDLEDSRARDIHRLQASETHSRDTVSNLLRAIETAKGDARDSSREAQTEARLRGEISALRAERDEALGVCSELKRKCSLLEEDVRLVKAKLSRVSQEKVKIERDSRATISLARSLDNHVSADSDYYKRKVAELNDRLQSQHAIVAEQKLQMDEMRRQIGRTMSQNRLAQLRTEDATGNRRRSY